MTTSAASHTDTNDESYENFLHIMKSGNSTTGEGDTVRRRTIGGSAPQDATAPEGPPAIEIEAGTVTSAQGGDGDATAPEAEAVAIPESTHSFLFTEPVRASPFWLGAGVAGVSGASLLIALIYNHKNSDVPVNVLSTVRCTQFLAILIVLMMEEEIPTGLELLRRISREDLALHCPRVSYPKFVAAAVLRVAMGYLFLLNVLVVLVYAEGVIEIFYDVLALQFIQQLDDIGFFLCKKDVLGKRLLRAARNPCFRKEFHEHAGGGSRFRIHNTLLRMAFFINLAIFVAVMTFFSISQANGYYHSHSVTVIFGDEVWDDAILKWPESTATYKEYKKNEWPTEIERALVFSFFNGVYAISDVAQFSEGRPIYLEQNKADRKPFDVEASGWHMEPYDPIQPAEIRYCKDRWIWTHRYIQKETANDSNEREGCHWLARSPQTQGYDLRHSAGLKWELWTGIIVQSELGIIDNECATSDDCNLNGECIDGRCECNKDNDGVTYLGEQCQTKLKDKCRVIVSEVDNATWSASTGSNGALELYSRPVYTYVRGTSLSNSRMDDELGKNDIYVLHYSGLRWYAALQPRVLDADPAAQQHWRWLTKNEHAFWTDVNLYSTQMSDPTKRDNPVGVDFFRIENAVSWVNGEMIRWGVKNEQFGPFGSLLPMQKNNQIGRGLYHCARPPACSFCPGGVSDADFVLPDSNGTTCGYLAGVKELVEAGSSDCQGMQLTEPLCCGGELITASNDTNKAVCSFCPKGISNAGFILPESNGTTCEEVAAYVNQVELVPSECQNIQLAEPACCVP